MRKQGTLVEFLAIRAIAQITTTAYTIVRTECVHTIGISMAVGGKPGDR